VALGLPLEGDSFSGRSRRLTGIPVREAAKRPAPPGLLSSWGWNGRRFTALVMGGSSGAGFINRLFCRAAPLWGEGGGEMSFIHLAGREEDEVAAAYRAAGLRAKVFRFFEDVGCLYSLADLLICRSGAVTLSEAAWWGIPMILIPYPWARDDHQHANALYFSSAGAAELWREELLSPEALVEAVRVLKNDPDRRKAMAERARALSRPRAAEDILDMIDWLTEAKKIVGKKKSYG